MEYRLQDAIGSTNSYVRFKDIEKLVSDSFNGFSDHIVSEVKQENSIYLRKATDKLKDVFKNELRDISTELKDKVSRDISQYVGNGIGGYLNNNSLGGFSGEILNNSINRAADGRKLDGRFFASQILSAGINNFGETIQQRYSNFIKVAQNASLRNS